MSLFRLLLFGLCSLALGACAGPYVPQEGDIVFHTSRSAQSLAIQQATRSPYSHMGVVLMRDGQPHVFEAARTVRYTPLREWLDRGVGGHYVVKRLDPPPDPQAIARLHAAARRFEGKPYDLAFAWSDRRIYCSELVWKLYRDALRIELAPPSRLGDFALDSPAVRAKLRERYGANVPLDEPVIAPAAIFDSPSLVTVARR
ncbi:MAG: YiiX family permuted papain-like enzyme [Xanthomonadaceae bacterium]|jgi:cell wall-associated NlpC family hydrolase|nr:YiiX family permuted papain-like enzyme [Xanthomonadaceae bacterium]